MTHKGRYFEYEIAVFALSGVTELILFRKKNTIPYIIKQEMVKFLIQLSLCIKGICNSKKFDCNNFILNVSCCWQILISVQLCLNRRINSALFQNTCMVN